LLFATSEWITSLLTPNNLAEIGLVILGMLALSASLQNRTLFEKAPDILRLMPNTPIPKAKKEANSLHKKRSDY